MPTEMIKYPRQLVDELHPLLVEAQHGAPVPTPSQLAQLLDAAWVATTLEEEGRRTVFGLACVTPSDVGGWGRAAPFELPAPLEPSRIAKLSPATHPRETMMGVRWTEAGEPEIWGLVHIGDQAILLDVEPALPFVRVIGFRPGGFVVEAQMQRLLMYSGGAARWYRPQSDSIQRLLRESAVLDPTAQKLGVTPGALSREFERLAERVVLAGHGGTLLISGPIDPNTPRVPPEGVTIRKTSAFAQPDPTLTNAFSKDEGVQVVLDPHGRKKAEREHRSALDYVARLANVDGAVVMGLDLRVYGFGAAIEVKTERDAMQLEWHEPTESSRTSQALVPFKRMTIGEAPGGHRHKSALHFCAMQLARMTLGAGHLGETAIAILISQDGSLSLCTIAGFNVVLIRPYLLRGRLAVGRG